MTTRLNSIQGGKRAERWKRRVERKEVKEQKGREKDARGKGIK